MITRLSLGSSHHFYGYYGSNPWDRSLRHHLALETEFHDHRPKEEDRARVGLVDRETGRFRVYATTAAFNLQQGSMMHWIRAGHGEEFTFNDWEKGVLVSRAVTPQTGAMRTLARAVAAVSPTEPIGIDLNFARMFHCRAVVGYANALKEPLDLIPEDDGLFRLDLTTGQAELVLSIADVVRASGVDTEGQPAWLNHVVFNTDGSRLLFLCRIRTARTWITSLWTVDPDGRNLACQIPFPHWISHFAWRDERRILISTDLHGPRQFFQFTDGEADFAPFGGDKLPGDGHACFSPDGRWLVCDTYPDEEKRLARLMLLDLTTGERLDVGAFFHPQPFSGDIRCDLHPRWSADSRLLTFDSIHEGSRQIYLAAASDLRP